MKLGIDLGGTNMRVGLVAGDTIIAKEIVPCPSRESENVVLEALASLIERNMTPDVDGIGIGVPTLVDSARGIVYNATNIPSWREVHLKDFIAGRFGVEVAVNNDANCFALGEARFGAGRDCGGLVGVTLGTGVGGGLVVDGKLYSGRNTGAAEIGELPFRTHTFEYYCSSVFFEREYGISGKDAAAAARAGDVAMQAVWREFGTSVGTLMKAVMFAYDPDVIVIGGGIASAFELYQPAMIQELSSFPYPESLRNIRIEPSRLVDVAILGAAALNL